jgi:plastocyanin
MPIQPIQQNVLRAMTVVTMLMIAACGNDSMGTPPTTPTPPPPVTIASAYILEGASTKGPLAFSDEPIIIYKGELMRWVNGDSMKHAVVSDTPGFLRTDELAPRGGEQSFLMTRIGTTTIHCSIHPSMVGTLVIRER